MTIRLVIADDHPVVRDGLRAVFAADSQLEVVGEAADGNEAVELAGTLRPDLVLMDLQMPGLHGSAATAAIRERFPEVNVLVLTTYSADSDIWQALDAGAVGYLLKDSRREELFAAVRSAARGESVLSPPVATRVLDQLRSPDERSLSKRECEILAEVAKGSSNRDIARMFHISESTVKTHLKHIFSKLGAVDRTGATTLALRRGIIRLDT